MAKIELKDVTFSYGNESSHALSHVNLTIENGEFVCLAGPSGCGKTTLLKLMAGLLTPASGDIAVNGVPVAGPCTEAAVVFQEYTLFPWMSGRKNVAFGIRQTHKHLSKQAINEKTTAILRRVGMEAQADKLPGAMSGGMRQRVAIARALAMDTDILLMDEPFGALDAGIRAELQDLLEELWNADGRQRKTVIFVTHDMEEAVRLADRVIYMEPGRIADDIRITVERPRAHVTGESRAKLRNIRCDLIDRMSGRKVESSADTATGCGCGTTAHDIEDTVGCGCQSETHDDRNSAGCCCGGGRE
ncbi:MAG: ABC transporter ATP-binding protein [Lachnospiraceae bacterium]|nr:ABC transporter ATP-binding protein [Lachnospiraceae bacterium]